MSHWSSGVNCWDVALPLYGLKRSALRHPGQTKRSALRHPGQAKREPGTQKSYVFR